MKSLFVFLMLVPALTWALPTKEQQFQASVNMVISNSTRSDVKPGMIVASPSRNNPDYYYDWVRDTALTMRALIDYYELTNNNQIKKMIFTWISAEAYRQNLPTLSGLGEPKYFIDGTGYTGSWGRPQNDGPALRAISMIKFARLLFKEGNQQYVIQHLYNSSVNSVIKKDLEYVAHKWKEHSFDLWEEEKGMHFYTLLAQQVALQEGALLARELQDMGAASFYAGESQKITQKLRNDFIDPTIGIKVTTERSAPLDYKNSGIDVAPLLALNHTSPYQKVFSLRDPAVVKYVNVLAATFSDIYSVNKQYSDLGVALGRYPEDRYDGYQTGSQGNPWFLSTLALGEYSCLLKNELRRRNALNQNVANELTKLTENQIKRALFHSDRKGGMSEQFNQHNGVMQGAIQLTWSHNAFMTIMMRCR